jgi:hypothetical protein
LLNIFRRSNNPVSEPSLKSTAVKQCRHLKNVFFSSYCVGSCLE